MSELYDFIKKNASHISGISFRKVYGLDSVFVKNISFLLVTPDSKIAVKIENREFLERKRRESLKIVELKLNDKVLPGWFVLPESFCRKRNKFISFIDSALEALFDRRKIKSKKRANRKANSQKSSNCSCATDASGDTSKYSKTGNIFQKIFSRLFS